MKDEKTIDSATDGTQIKHESPPCSIRVHPWLLSGFRLFRVFRGYPSAAQPFPIVPKLPHSFPSVPKCSQAISNHFPIDSQMVPNTALIAFEVKHMPFSREIHDCMPNCFSQPGNAAKFSDVNSAKGRIHKPMRKPHKT
jgi:hypothetical protein